MRRTCRSLIAAILLLSLAGCSTPGDMPRDRLGSLPFPGLLTFFRIADPANLGQHCSVHPPSPFGPDEARGILYTTRAGFLDLAHIHITIDTARYCADHIRWAIEQGETEVTLSTIEGSLFHVSLHYPPDWDASLNDEASQRELSIRIGERVAYLMMTWHELITWFGYRTFPLVDESPSAFTYDDPMSHAVGLMVADRVLRGDPTISFDAAATRTLSAVLAELGAVSPAETERAVRSVQGVWWGSSGPLKRQVDVGVLDGIIHPWLVRSPESPNDGPPPEPYRLRSLHDVEGNDFSSFYSVSIDPQIPHGARIRELLPSHPERFSADSDVPILMDIVRREMREQISQDVDQPWPGATAAGAARRGTALYGAGH